MDKAEELGGKVMDVSEEVGGKILSKAKELGGSVPPGFPFDLPDGIGAIALVQDPGGHPIGLYSRKLLPAKPAAK